MIKNELKLLIKKAAKPILRRLRHLLREIEKEEALPPSVPFDNTYPWLQYVFSELTRNGNDLSVRKPMYAWGVIQGTALAKVLGIPRISIVEFGVAGGAGLISLEYIAQLVETKTGIGIDVYGFDTAVGLPAPRDYRDQPNMWFEAQFPMDRGVLERQLRRASLRIGLVRDTVQQFLAQCPAPVAFVSFDLDLYSSTRDALALFSANTARLLPRVVCYFDDIMGHSYSDFTGERLAISEFNDSHAMRKLCPIYGLRNFVWGPFRQAMYWDCFYFAHCFDHPLYNKPDSLEKPVYIDDANRTHRSPIESDWRRDTLRKGAKPGW
jgi:hypothetical protein